MENNSLSFLLTALNECWLKIIQSELSQPAAFEGPAKKTKNPQLYLNVPTALVFVVGSTTQTATELGTLEFVKVLEIEFGFT